ncbi:MAG: four-carbon acid sugar kinase family protein, partial [Deltaproteobacteria bacterium]|nr:four-carbon acid sugar kinase family protein [Deltaproteobacteria bacterium]
MIEILVIADTLSGSAGTGAKFSNNGPVKLISLRKQDWSGIKGVLAVHTDARAEDPAKIPGILESIKPLLMGHRPGIVYKRIDSCLRGFVGLEVASALRAFGLSFALVAPAQPEFGRTTVKGIHMVDNKPVHITEHAKDPIKPVMDSRLKNVISQDHGLRVESIELDTLRNGPGAIEAKLKEFLAKGDQFIVACDSEFDFDLDLLAKGSRELAHQILFAGSSGFAGILADMYTTKSHNWLEDEFHPPTPQLPIVFIGGSYSKILREQLIALANDHGGELVTVNVDALINGLGQTIPLVGPSSPLILTLPDKGPDEEFQKKYPLAKVLQKLGILASDLVKNRQFNSIFLSGGDLARETLRAMGLTEIWIRSEMSQGVVFSSSGALS